MKIRSRILETDEELKDYARRYAAASGHGGDYLAYFRRISTVRGFFDQDDRLVGGYTLNTNTPIRYYQDLPQDSLAAEPPPEEEVVEGACLWFDRAVPAHARCRAFLHGLLEIRRTGKRYIISGARHPKIAAIQRGATPHTIYEGPMDTAPYVCILYGETRSLVRQSAYFVLRYGLAGPVRDFVSKARHGLTTGVGSGPAG